jgi:hypothetical protein
MLNHPSTFENRPAWPRADAGQALNTRRRFCLLRGLRSMRLSASQARKGRNMANWYGYHFYQSGVKRHSGITTDPTRRQTEHQQRWPGGTLHVVTGAMTEAQARAWEAQQSQTITPPRK